jgi:hypothetical protein
LIVVACLVTVPGTCAPFCALQAAARIQPAPATAHCPSHPASHQASDRVISALAHCGSDVDSDARLAVSSHVLKKPLPVWIVARIDLAVTFARAVALVDPREGAPPGTSLPLRI